MADTPIADQISAIVERIAGDARKAGAAAERERLAKLASGHALNDTARWIRSQGDTND